MSNAMDGVSLVRNGGDHHHSNASNVEESKKKKKKRIITASVVPHPTIPLPPVDILMGENSNGSSSSINSNGPTERDELEAKEEDVLPKFEIDPSSKSINEQGRSQEVLAPADKNSNSESHYNRSNHRYGSSHNHNNSSSVHHHNRRFRPTPRANYCQFETPADESRGTFPDDFDEELFIHSGQLVETSNEARFDEEMETNHHHNHLNGQLNLDTADHSESSDIEDSLYPAGTNSTTATTTPPTNNCTNNSSSSNSISTSRLCSGSGNCKTSSSSSSSSSSTSSSSSSCNLSIHEPNLPVTSSVTSVIVNNSGTSSTAYEPLEEPMHEDLSSSDNADEPSRPENQGQKFSNANKEYDDNLEFIPDDSPYYNFCHDEQDHEDGVNDLEDVKPDVSASPMRKRKGLDVYNVELPEKRPLTVIKQELEEFDSEGEESDSELMAQDRCKSSRVIIPTKENPPAGLDEWLNTFADWGHAERLMAINELIQTCEPTQVRHMMKVIEPQFQRDFISLLPKELALYVLSFLEPKDLLKAAQTCRYWRILCDDNLLWREKCKEAGVGYFSAMSQRVHNKRGRVSQVICPNCVNGNSCGSSSCCNEPPAQPNMSRWKAAYLRQHNVEMNWRFIPIKPSKILKGHDDHVITCLQFSANRIVSGSDDNTLKVWSANTGKCLRTLMGHTGGVWSSQMSGTTIVSGSTDRTLRVWNAETGNCLHTLYGHTSTVRCMHLYGRKVVSGSRDATLRVWDVDTGECLHVLVGHMAAVRCVQYNGTTCVSGAYDYMVRVWNVEREECLHQLQGHTNRVYSLQFDGIHVVSGSLDTSIRVWDVKTGACKHTLMGHQSLTSGMELRDNLLVSGNADSTVKIWDINTGQCLLTLSGQNKHLSAVTCLQLINKFVITSSDDGTVKLWDIRTGDFVRNLVQLASGGSGGVVWRIRASETKLVCAVGSRNGTEETKLIVLDFDVEPHKPEPLVVVKSEPSA